MLSPHWPIVRHVTTNQIRGAWVQGGWGAPSPASLGPGAARVPLRVGAVTLDQTKTNGTSCRYCAALTFSIWVISITMISILSYYCIMLIYHTFLITSIIKAHLCYFWFFPPSFFLYFQ